MRHSLAVILVFALSACSVLDPLPNGDAPGAIKANSAEELYADAKAFLNEGEYNSALKRYEALQARYPYGRYAQQAMLEMAYTYYRQDEPEPAIATTDRFIKQFPNNPNLDYAYYLKGLASFNGEISALGRLGNQDMSERDPSMPQRSFEAFKELVTRYPNSRYAPDARLRMQYLVNMLAKHDLNIARYYHRRHAYVAAVNRAQNILQTYPNSPATRDALAIMVQCYDAMGMPQLRDDTQRILTQNGGPSVTLLSDQGEQPWWQIWK